VSTRATEIVTSCLIDLGNAQASSCGGTGGGSAVVWQHGVLHVSESVSFVHANATDTDLSTMHRSSVVQQFTELSKVWSLIGAITRNVCLV